MIKLNRLIDKTSLLLLGIITAVFLGLPITSSVSGMLIYVIVLSLSELVKSKTAFYIIHGISAFLCLIYPMFFLFFPISIYDIYYREKNYVKLFSTAFLLLSFIGGSVLFGLTVIISGLISVLLSERTSQNQNLKKSLIILRDTSEENQILLRERNEYLTKSKNDEINLAVMSERNRIAREIHDNVGHMLSRTILQMGALKIINKDENIKPHLDEINNSLNSAMTCMRNSVHNLHDDSISFDRTVKEIVKHIAEKFSVKLDMSNCEQMPKDIKLCIIGIIKEAVSNIIKHSNGDKVNITVRDHPSFYQVLIEDNGKNNGNINTGGMGLENMKIRTENMGGIFNIISNRNCFKIFASIPKNLKQSYN